MTELVHTIGEAYHLSKVAFALAKRVLADPAIRESLRHEALHIEHHLDRLGREIEARDWQHVDENALLYVSEGILDARFVDAPRGTTSLRLARARSGQSTPPRR